MIAAVGNSLEVVGSRKCKLVADVLLDEVAEKSFDLIVLPVSVLTFKDFHCKKNKNLTTLM